MGESRLLPGAAVTAQGQLDDLAIEAKYWRSRPLEAGVAGVAPWKPVLRKDVLSSVLEYLQSVTKQISKEIKLRWLSI